MSPSPKFTPEIPSFSPASGTDRKAARSGKGCVLSPVQEGDGQELDESLQSSAAGRESTTIILEKTGDHLIPHLGRHLN